MIDQFPSGFHPYIVDVVNLLKELTQCHNEYVQLFKGEHRIWIFEELTCCSYV